MQGRLPRGSQAQRFPRNLGGGAFGPGSPALLIERHGCPPFASLAWLLLRPGVSGDAGFRVHWLKLSVTLKGWGCWRVPGVVASQRVQTLRVQSGDRKAA